MADDQPIQLSPTNRAWLHAYATELHGGDLSAALDHLITAARLAADQHYETTGRTGSRYDSWAAIDAERDERNRRR